MLLFSCSVVFNSLWPQGLQHTRLLCALPSPRVCSNSCPMSQWYHPSISSSDIPFSCLQSSSASGSFPMSHIFWARWPKCWSFSFNISLSSEYPGLLYFRIDWFDPFAIEGTLKSLLRNHNLKAYIFQPSAFFMVQLSHPYMTTGKTITFTRWIFVSKMMSWFLICYLGLS